MPTRRWAGHIPPGRDFRLNRDSPQAEGLIGWFAPRRGRAPYDMMGNPLSSAGVPAYTPTTFGIAQDGDSAGAAYHTVNLKTPLNPQAGTVAFWIVFTTNTGAGQQRTFHNMEDGAGIQIMQDGFIGHKLRFSYVPSGYSYKAFYETSAPTVNTLYHYVFTYYISGSNVVMNLYRNGAAFGNSTQASGAFSGVDVFRINEQTDTMLYDLRWYDRVLSEPEWSHLYTRPYDLYDVPRVIFPVSIAAAATATWPVVSDTFSPVFGGQVVR